MKWIVGLSIIAVVMGRAAIATIPAAVAVDNAGLKFLPPETASIAVIDVADFFNAPLIQTRFRNIGYPPRFVEFITATGIDPQKDVDKVTVGKIGPRDVLVIVQGRFDKFKIEQYYKDKGKVGEAYLGQTLYHEGRDRAVVVLDGIVLVGQIDAVKKGIDQMQLPGSAPLRSDLQSGIQTIEGGNQVWGVGDFSTADLGAVGISGPLPALEMLKSLKGGTYQLRIDTGVHARGTGNFGDEETVRNLRDLAKGALAVARLQIANRQPDLLPLLDGIQISSNGTTLVVTVDEPGDLLQKLQNLKPGGAGDQISIPGGIVDIPIGK